MFSGKPMGYIPSFDEIQSGIHSSDPQIQLQVKKCILRCLIVFLAFHNLCFQAVLRIRVDIRRIWILPKNPDSDPDPKHCFQATKVVRKLMSRQMPPRLIYTLDNPGDTLINLGDTFINLGILPR